jgi:hypothetical protein
MEVLNLTEADDEGVDGYTTCDVCGDMSIPVVEGVAELVCESCEIGVPVSLCVDCVVAGANGPDDVDPDWSGFAGRWEGWLFGPVLTDAYGYLVEPHYVRPGTSCDGCETTLGGDRFDYVAVPKVTVRREPDDDAA